MKIHFIGIGGIGVSALAHYYLAKGDEVSGSDLAFAETIESVKEAGAKITIGPHTAENVPSQATLVIYSPAVEQDNPELQQAKRLGIQTQSYPEALGVLTKKHYTIAVSGTHGKSTTTCMIALILVRAGLDPTVIVGTRLKEFGNKNFRMGKGKYLVIEADEWNASFLNYWPKMIVLTTIEAEHLDYYRDLKQVIQTFETYVGHLPKGGTLVANTDDRNIAGIQYDKKNIRYRGYSIKQKEAAMLRKTLNIPGEYNISNALGALAVSRILRIPDRVAFSALSRYRGAWRRFEIHRGSIGNKCITVVSDYGHHPTEVRVTLQAAREKFKTKKIWCVFQPHQYQRTFYLFDEFVSTFAAAPVDRLVVTDIYSVAGRETKAIKKKVSSQKLVRAVAKDSVVYVPNAKIVQYLKVNLQGGEILMIMGAGDIYTLVQDFTSTH